MLHAKTRPFGTLFVIGLVAAAATGLSGGGAQRLLTQTRQATALPLALLSAPTFPVIDRTVTTALAMPVGDTRNIYGYVRGIGSDARAIDKIVITDMADGRKYNADGWGWHFMCPGGLRWFKNGLKLNHSYFVDVYTQEYGSQWASFRLTSGWGDFRAAVFYF